MAIERTKRQSDLEKRLQILRRQVYGKPDNSVVQIRSDHQKIRPSEDQKSDTLIYRSTDTPTHRQNETPTGLPSGQVLSDLTYLHQDLLKILIFSSIAIGGQIILFILLQNHILNFNFF